MLESPYNNVTDGLTVIDTYREIELKLPLKVFEHTIHMYNINLYPS